LFYGVQPAERLARLAEQYAKLIRLT